MTRSWFGTLLLAALIGCGTGIEAPAVRRSPADSAAVVSRPVMRVGATQPATAAAGVRGYVGQNVSYSKSYAGRVLVDLMHQAEEPVVVGNDLRISVLTKGKPEADNGAYQVVAAEPFTLKLTGGSPADIAQVSDRAYEVKLRATPQQTAQIHLLFVGRTTLPQGVRVIRPGYTVADADSLVWTREYVGLLKALNCGAVRSMDWQRTNGNETTTWDSRCKPQDALWGVKGKGGPVEPVIALCNTLGADLWVNIPHKADDDFVRQCLALCRDTLDPKLFVWVELSNEVWNSAAGFPQGAWFLAQGNALAATDSRFAAAPPTKRQRWAYAKRAKEIDGIGQSVFRWQPWRCKTMLAGQTGDSSVLANALEFWPECRTVATGGYFNAPNPFSFEGMTANARAVYGGQQFAKFSATAGDRAKLIYEWSNSTPAEIAAQMNADTRVGDSIRAAGDGQAANGIWIAAHFVPLASDSQYSATDEVGKWTAKADALAEISARRVLPFAEDPAVAQLRAALAATKAERDAATADVEQRKAKDEQRKAKLTELLGTYGSN